MKRIFRIFISLAFLLGLSLSPQLVVAQTSLEDAIRQFDSDNTKGYLQPFIDSFGNNLNSGIYRGTKIQTFGLNIQIGLVGMITQIPDEDRTFLGTPPAPYPQNQVTTATIFGESGAVVSGAGGLEFNFQDGQIQGDAIPFAVPQLEVGSILGTNVILRYFSAELEYLPKIELQGYGLRHSISQYIPLFPLDISVGYFRQTFDFGDLISAETTSIGIQVSKSFPVLTLYGGVASESAEMDVEYVFEETNEKIALKLESDSGIRFTAGARLALGILILNGDFNIGNQNAFSAGVGIGF